MEFLKKSEKGVSLWPLRCTTWKPESDDIVSQKLSIPKPVKESLHTVCTIIAHQSYVIKKAVGKQEASIRTCVDIFFSRNVSKKNKIIS